MGNLFFGGLKMAHYKGQFFVYHRVSAQIGFKVFSETPIRYLLSSTDYIFAGNVFLLIVFIDFFLLFPHIIAN